MTRILAIGDLHLDEWRQHAPVDRLADMKDALNGVVQIAAARRVDAVLIAGDVYQQPRPSDRARLVFAHFVNDLLAIGDVVCISGNASHDITASGDLCALDTHAFLEGGFTLAREPRNIAIPGAVVCCLPSVPVANLVAKTGITDRGEINVTAAQLLVDTARELHGADPGCRTILLGHWSVSGASYPNGLPVNEAHEPVLPLADLEEIGFDAMVFGHIHRPQYLAGHGFYTGSPWPLNHGEEHFEHGVRVVDLAAGTSEFVEIESREFKTINYDVEQQLLSDEGEIDGAIVRVKYTCTREQQRRIDVNEIRAALFSAGAARVTFEADIVREQRARVEGLDAQLDATGALDLYLAAQEWDDDERRVRVRAAAVEVLETVA